MALTPEQALLAKVQLADQVIALVKGAGVLGAKRGRKPGSKNKPKATAPKKKAPKPLAPKPNGGDEQQPVGGEGE